ncbi:hypothetical protein GIB67_017896 [Kingdonia uniflora]|uniref:Germin-like protein n=1 Tax=Kingdonia uniflora TaxID=39325 RepID=A0A7J7P5W1_9MAGN|nr:hypothetical protein GIB67_017896 [Kingdonia uniflora]
MVCIDYAPWGVNAPHTHPRASEILTVLEGTLYVGFVTSNPENRLIAKTFQKGDVFVFPVGLTLFLFIFYSNLILFHLLMYCPANSNISPN